MNSVGVPTHEKRLTDALQDNIEMLLRPGRGRQLFVVEEAKMPVGRPDLVFIAVSPRTIEYRQRRGLRFWLPSDAQVLAAAVEGHRSGFSGGGERQIRGRLKDSGWLSADGQPTVSVEHRVGDSLTVEAKMKDWRRGIVQVARGSPDVHRSALALPEERQKAVKRQYLKRNGFGLLAIDDCGAVRRVWTARRQRLSLAADLWLVELAIRQYESRQHSQVGRSP